MRNLGLSIPAATFLLATAAVVPVAQTDFALSPTFPSAILSHSRGSLATMFDSAGKLTYAPNNLLTQSNTFSNAAWIKINASVSNANAVSDPFGGNTASTLTATANNGLIFQNATYTNASTTNGVVSLWIKRRTGSGAITLYRPDGSNTTVPAVTGAWTQVASTGVGGAGVFGFSIQFATSGDAVDIYNATISAVTYETSPRIADQVITTSAAYYGPRVDYDPATLAVRGLLIEEARTNYLGYSSDFTKGAIWQLSNITPTANATTAPDGTNTAQKLTVTASTFASVVGSAFSAGSTTGNAYSVYVKQGSGPTDMNGFILRDYTLSTNLLGVTVDYSTGAITYTIGSTGASMVSVGNGWWRLTLAAAASANGDRLNVYVGGTGGTLTAGQYMYAWGGQVEAGSFATSYIPTAAASVTRAADVVQFTGAALTALQGSAATFIGQTIGLPFNPAANSALAAATAGNAVIAYVTNSNAVGVAAAATYNGAAALTVGTPNYTTAMRIGSAFSGSGRSLVVNGGSVATDANAIGSRPAVYLGGTGASLYLNGWMQSFAIYNQRLPDATLQAKSVVGASYVGASY